MTTRRRDRSWLIALPILAILLWSVVYPNVTVIAGSFENQMALGDSKRWFKSDKAVVAQKIEMPDGASGGARLLFKFPLA